MAELLKLKTDEQITRETEDFEREWDGFYVLEKLKDVMPQDKFEELIDTLEKNDVSYKNISDLKKAWEKTYPSEDVVEELAKLDLEQWQDLVKNFDKVEEIEVDKNLQSYDDKERELDRDSQSDKEKEKEITRVEDPEYEHAIDGYILKENIDAHEGVSKIMEEDFIKGQIEMATINRRSMEARIDIDAWKDRIFEEAGKLGLYDHGIENERLENQDPNVTKDVMEKYDDYITKIVNEGVDQDGQEINNINKYTLKHLGITKEAYETVQNEFNHTEIERDNRDHQISEEEFDRQLTGRENVSEDDDY